MDNGRLPRGWRTLAFKGYVDLANEVPSDPPKLLAEIIRQDPEGEDEED